MAGQTPSEAAEAARRRLGVGVDGPLPDPLRLIEDEADVAVFVLSLPEGGVDGAYMIDRGRPFILINQNGHPSKKRFTLAHEYGHHFLEHGTQWDATVDPRGGAGVEREANDFAGAFLMPTPAVDQWFSANMSQKVDLEVLVRFAFFFNVSTPAALVRLGSSQLMRVTKTAERSLWTDLRASRHTRLAKQLLLEYDADSLAVEHGAGGHVPTRMQRRIVDGVTRGLLDEDAAVGLLHLPDAANARKRLADLRRDECD